MHGRGVQQQLVQPRRDRTREAALFPPEPPDLARLPDGAEFAERPKEEPNFLIGTGSPPGDRASANAGRQAYDYGSDIGTPPKPALRIALRRVPAEVELEAVAGTVERQQGRGACRK